MNRTGKQAPRSRARDRARHEEEILGAAERLFARKGYGSATMVEVANEAGFAIATLYNLFGSKEAILQGLLERHLRALMAELERATAPAKTPRERLRSSVIARAHYLGEHRDFFLLYVNEVPGAHVSVPQGNDVVVKCVAEQLAHVESIFADMRGAVLDPATRALVFYGATRAYIIERVLKGKKPPRDRELVALVDALLDGLAPNG